MEKKNFLKLLRTDDANAESVTKLLKY
jgi:hypothetical protein